MVRLVFRPYTQVRRSICTLESLRASTRVSPGFTLLRHSSPSFGSQHICSHSNLFPVAAWSVSGAPNRDLTSASASACLYFHYALGDSFVSQKDESTAPSTRTHVRLLGPCFKTGCREAFRQGLVTAFEAQSESVAQQGLKRFPLTPDF